MTSKTVAALAVSLAFYLAFGALLVGAARCLAPWDLRLLGQTIGLRTGLGSHPIALVAVTCSLLALASSATAALSSLAAFFVRSPSLTLLVPVIVAFSAALAAPPAFNPYVRATFLGVFFGWNTVSGALVYWLAVLAVGWSGALALAVLGEE